MVAALWFPPVGTFGIVLAVGGTIVALVEFKGVLRVVLVTLCLLLGAGEVVSIISNDRIHDHEIDEQKRAVEEQKRQVEGLKAMIQTNEIRNAGDMGYMKGRLEAALSRPQFDTKKFAEAMSQQIKAEIESLSDKQLADATLKLCQELRVFAAEQSRKQRVALNQQWEEQMSTHDPVKEQQIWDKWRQQNDADRASYEYEYRTKYMGRAVHFRDEMWQRIGIEESQLKGSEMADQLAFRGFLSGPTPVEDVANYLDALAHRLQSKLH